MHDVELILTLTGGLGAALLLGYATHRLGLSPIVGYLLAGIVVGPHTPGFVADRALSEQLAEIGVILLMFGVGLHFQLKDLLAVRRVAIPGALGQSAFATLLAAGVASAFGFGGTSGVVFGIALSVASTVVLVRVLTDHRDLHTPTGHIAVGWLVVEDLFTVLVLVLLPALLAPGTGGGARVPVALGIALLKIGGLVALTFVVGGRAIPWLIARVSDTRSRELFTLTILVVALGLAVGSAALFGVSMALGAFLAGMIVGRSEFSLRAANDALPMRDAFSVLFFVSIGLLFDPRQLVESPGLVAATLGVVLIGKPLAALGIVLLLRHPLKTALAVAVALAQIGEFSFLLARVGNQLGVLPAAATHALIAAAIVSITLNPLLYRCVDPLAAWITGSSRLARWIDRRAFVAAVASRAASREADVAQPAPRDAPHRAIVVGYGPVGRTVTRLLRENEIDTTVLELNPETVRRLRDEGVKAVHGDATREEVLRLAGIENADSLILSASHVGSGDALIRLARKLQPGVRIIARTDYVRDLAAMRDAGAAAAFSGEAEVALALTEKILRDLGATAEQIDRERERVRGDLG